MSNISYLTQEGYDKLVAELDRLKTDERQAVAAAIAEAREKGDLSENAEYDAAKDAQGLLEMKINELEKVYANARVIDASQLDSSKITVLSKVELRNIRSDKEITYQLVAEAEADIKAKKISVNSPIGKGLLGKAVGEIAVIKTPRGNMEFEVLSITL
jgi:transcription elongation factor GreA